MNQVVYVVYEEVGYDYEPTKVDILKVFTNLDDAVKLCKERSNPLSYPPVYTDYEEMNIE